jgi:hypothetical protein
MPLKTATIILTATNSTTITISILYMCHYDAVVYCESHYYASTCNYNHLVPYLIISTLISESFGITSMRSSG